MEHDRWQAQVEIKTQMLSFCPFLLALSRKCQKLDRIKKNQRLLSP